MAQASLILQLTWAIVSALLYVHIGRTILRRATSPASRLANDLFALFWFGLAGLWAVAGAFIPLASGTPAPWLLALMLDLAILSICVACWGIHYYLVFLYTGERRWLLPLTTGYVLLLAFFVALIAWREPVALQGGTLGASVIYARAPSEIVSIVSGLLLTGPIVIAAIAYGTLFWRVQDRAARARIAIVSLSFMCWFGWSVVQNATGLSRARPDDLGLLLLNRGLGILFPLLILAAFRPPAWLRARTGLVASEERA